MKRRFWLLALLLVFHLAQGETHIPAGPVSGTWTLAGSPYIIEGNVIVEIAGSLSIQPGVIVIMNPGCRFRIEGRLLAVGTISDSIRFTAADTLIGLEGLHFLNTNFSSLDSSKLVYCEISHGVATIQPDPYMHGGGLYVKNSSRLLISHCLLTNCYTVNATGSNGANGSGGYPIGNPGSPGGAIHAGNGGALYIENCSPNVFSSVFAYNHTGHGYGGNGGNGASISDSAGSSLHGGFGGVGGDGSGGFGAAIYLKNSAANLRDNVFHHNFTGTGYGGTGGQGGMAVAGQWAYGGAGGIGGRGFGGEGGAICTENSSAQMDNNLFYANKPGGGVGGDGGNGGVAWAPEPYGLTATPGVGGAGGDGHGGNGYALFAGDSPSLGVRLATVTQHTVQSPGQGGSGGYSGGGLQAAPGQGIAGTSILGGPTFLLVNSIVWNNTDPTIDPAVLVTYSCIQGGHTGPGVIAVDPLFVNPGAQQFYLSQIASGQTQNSPCVDTGNPASFMITGSTRTDNVQDAGTIDMGYHYPLISGLPQFDLTMIPVSPPILIPAGGGSFNFTATITNEGTSSYNFQAWTMQLTPSGNWQGPLLGPLNLTLASNRAVTRLRSQNVPMNAPPGVYTYRGYVGLNFEFRWDSSGFTYEKLTTGAQSAVGDWACTGELFPGEEALSSSERYSFEPPSAFNLNGITPNPFNPTTVIIYQIPEARVVRLHVYDISGRRVTTLVDGWRQAGTHQVTFDGSNLASGLYFVSMNAGGYSQTKKMILLK